MVDLKKKKKTSEQIEQKGRTISEAALPDRKCMVARRGSDSWWLSKQISV